MELVDKNKITFEPIEIYNIDEHKHEITGMALFKDIEKIPIIKAIPLDEIKQAREKLQKILVGNNWEYLSFTPNSPKRYLKYQCDVMLEYMQVLEERARKENIDLD